MPTNSSLLTFTLLCHTASKSVYICLPWRSRWTGKDVQRLPCCVILCFIIRAGPCGFWWAGWRSLEKSNHSFSKESNGVSQADTQSLDGHWGSGVFWVLQVYLSSHFWLFTAAVKTLARVCTHRERSANPTSNINDGKGEGELNTTMESRKFHTEGVSTYPKRK